MSDTLSLIPAAAFRRANLGKFQAKLDFEQRCAILAAYTNNVRRDVLAVAFNVDRRTVGHIVNPTSTHYKDVRKRLKDDGPEAFTRTFLTEALALQIGAAVKADVQQAADPQAPNAKSNKMQGLHTLKPPQCAYSHRIEIAWHDKEFREDASERTAPGWYYRDLDSKDSELWLHNGPDSMRTSQLCLSYAEQNLMDD